MSDNGNNDLINQININKQTNINKQSIVDKHENRDLDLDDDKHKYLNSINLQNQNEIKNLGIECEINTKTNCKIQQSQNYFPQAMKSQINQEIQRLLKLGYIRKSKSN